MFGTSKYGASAYAKVGVETGVASANPHKLIVMLFDGALIALGHAQQHMRARNISDKGRSISKTIDIIENGLRASLNRDAGGEIATNLDALYAYMSNRLVEANLANDLIILEEVKRLLSDLKSAWEAIQPTPSSIATATHSSEPPRMRMDSYSPTSSTLAKA